ncbi:MAG TPA: acylneuraminate cytidylyltransferase family protein [Vicinamibacterales bacterium]|nr:acylneuraminate cytidylyltransferase family protein [Vicinamibacterales bacterium]
MTGGAARVLAVIPARGGSKGLPGKNIRPLAGLPLIAHSLACARACQTISRTIVSTDSAEIANVARAHGGDAPFVRPAELADDTTPMWPVLRHALAFVESEERQPYDVLVLLDPTSPGRLPGDITAAVQRLDATPEADGIIGVSRPEFNPLWHCVVERGGWMADLNPDAATYARRQDVPTVYRINATLYAWRARFVRAEAADWRANGRNLLYELPEARAIHIDDADEFAKAEALIAAGLIALPWLPAQAGTRA